MAVVFSIIVCSRKNDIPEPLKISIAETIGVEYEVVVIDNSHNDYSLFSAYNEGVRHAKGEILCFCHEDILFHTPSWGGSVQDLFYDASIGVVGVIG